MHINKVNIKRYVYTETKQIQTRYTSLFFHDHHKRGQTLCLFFKVVFLHYISFFRSFL